MKLSLGMATWIGLIICSSELCAQVPLSGDSWQLQQLILKSEQQLKVVQELLKQAKTDSSALQKASQTLTELSSGLDRSIDAFQGTQDYEKALLRYQKELAQQRKAEQAEKSGATGEDVFSATFLNFQTQSLLANEADLKSQARIGEALKEAGPGFVPKLQAQTQLGTWQSNTRISSQLAEVLGLLKDLRGESGARLRQESGFGLLLSGSALQSEKQRKGVKHGDH